MSKPSDVLLDPETGDLQITNGGLVAGDATHQNQRLLLLIEKSELKYAPLDTVGIRSYLDDEDPREMEREIRRVFTKDGQVVKSIGIAAGGKLNIDAAYED